MEPPLPCFLPSVRLIYNHTYLRTLCRHSVRLLVISDSWILSLMSAVVRLRQGLATEGKLMKTDGGVKSRYSI